MQEFKYSFLAKFVYRYANIPISLLLVFYIISSAVGAIENWTLLLPLFLNLILLLLMNKFYFKMYRQFPYKIKANNEKMICSEFMNKQKIVEIELSKITNIKGGIFSGSPVKPIYIYDDEQNIIIGFNHHLKGFNKLLTVILSNIQQDLYNKLLENIKENSIINKLQKKDSKKGKKKKPLK